METKTKKKIFTVLLGISALALVASTGVAVYSANAEGKVAQPVLTMQTGAAIRTFAPTGIRFVSEISKTDYETLTTKNAEFYTLIIPEKLVPEGGITADNYMTVNAERVQAKNSIVVGTDTVTFSGTLVGKDNGDGTYSYPEGKEDYLTSPPYSGILTLVENQRISNLVYDGYTEDEKSWIELAATPEYYIENDLIDYILPKNETYAAQAQNNMYEAVVVKAWTGQADPSLTFHDAIMSYRSRGKDHVEYQATAYKSMKARFEALG